MPQKPYSYTSLFSVSEHIGELAQALWAQSEKTFARIYCADRRALDERVRAGRLINAKLKYVWMDGASDEAPRERTI